MKKTTKKQMVREATNDLANTIIEGDDALLARAREIIFSPDFTPQRKGRLMGNLRGHALAAKYPAKTDRNRAVARLMS